MYSTNISGMITERYKKVTPRITNLPYPSLPPMGFIATLEFAPFSSVMIEHGDSEKDCSYVERRSTNSWRIQVDLLFG